MQFFAILIFSTLISASAFSQSSEQDRDRATIDQLGNTVRFLAHLNLRCNTKNDCEVVAMGSKACGGPAEYVITSRYNPHHSVVEDLAKTVTQKEDDYNQRYNVISDCTAPAIPAVKCEWKRCRY